nr:cuticle protein 64 [Helicoverpa armigera]
MNTYIALACLLAVAHGSAIGGLGGLGGYGLGYGYGAPILAGPAISTANLVKAAPIPVIKTAIAPVVTAPIVTAPVLRTVSVAAPINVGYGLGGLGLGGYGLGGGWGGLGGLGGWGGLGWGGWGVGGKHIG